MRDLVLNVRDLVRKPGDSKQVAFSVGLDQSIDVGILNLPFGSDLKLELLLESVQEGMLASGSIAGEAHGQCSRCLEALSLPVQVDFEELFA
jgi:uncharacterized protein